MSDFTQKLLQRTQARKEALALKRENLANSRSDVSSTRFAQRGPLSPKDLNASKVGHQTQNNGRPASFQHPAKRESPTKNGTSKGELLDKRPRTDSSVPAVKDGSKACEVNSNSRSNRVPEFGVSVKDRLASLQSQTQKFQNDILERKKERQMDFQKQKETTNRKGTSSRGSDVVRKQEDSKAKTEIDISRMTEGNSSEASNTTRESIQNGKPISTSDIDRILGLMEADSPPRENYAKKEPSQRNPSVGDTGSQRAYGATPKRDYQSDKRYVKAYADKEELDSIKVLRGGSNQTRSKSNVTPMETVYTKSNELKNSGWDTDSMADDTTDLSVSVSELSSEALDSEQVDSTMCDDEDEDSYDSGQADYESEGESESEAFDISGVLRAANTASARRQISKQNLLPDEEQEFHVLSPMTPRPTDKDAHAQGMDLDESLVNPPSAFERMLRDKRNQIKSPATVNKLDNLDKDLNSKAIQQAEQQSKIKVENSKPRIEMDGTDEILSCSNAENQQDIEADSHLLKIEIPKMPLSPAFSTVREKSKSKTKARRSVSFSGNRSSPKIIFKSGYNEEASAKYNVKSNIEDVKDENKNASNHEKIQFYLEEAANHQSIVLQASQALNLSYGSCEDRRGCPEVVEGERLLLLATQKRTACLDEVQRLKQLGDPFSRKREKTSDVVPPCKGAITFSGINLPLNQDFMVALRAGRMDLGVFHFVVVVQHGPMQVSATSAVSTYDQLKGNCLPFKEKIVVKSVPHDFTVVVKVFGMHTKRTDTSSKGKRPGSASKQGKDSPSLMKNMFSSLTPRRRAHSDDSPGASSPQKTIFRNSNFTLVGETKMNLTTLGAGKHVLVKVPSNSPLEGFIQVDARCVPEFSAKATGFLTLFEDVGGYTALNRRWCVLQNNALSCWRYPGDENTKEPLSTIDFKWCTNKVVSLITRDQCARPHTFEVILKRLATKDDQPSLLASIDGKYITIKHWLSADDKEDRISWLDTINKLLSDHRSWQVKKTNTKQEYSQSKNSLRMSNRRLRKTESSNVATKC